MDLVGTKILVAVLFFLLRFAFGMLPVKLYSLLSQWENENDPKHLIHKRRHQIVTCFLALLQSFGGGVLFATCFLHMMPEVYRSVEELKTFGHFSTPYPLSQLIICMGFFTVYFVEEFSHWFVTRVPNDAVTCNKSRGQSSNNRVTPVQEKPKEFLAENDVDENSSPVFEKTGPYIIDNEREKEKLIDIGDSYFGVDDKQILQEIERNNEKNKENDKEEIPVEMMDKELQKNDEDVNQEMEKQAKSKRQIVRQCLTALALSLHAIFEGLSIGLQGSIANIWYLFVAVSVHSITILFYISLELVLAKTRTKMIVFDVVALSVPSPLGVLLGLLISLNYDMNTRAKSTAVVLLEGISAGTILYITFFEVLHREKERRIYVIRRSLAILGGFALMGILQCVEIHIHQ